MPRGKQKAPLTPAQKRSQVAAARAEVREQKSLVKPLRANLTQAKKDLRAAEVAFNKQMRAVDKAQAQVERMLG